MPSSMLQPEPLSATCQPGAQPLAQLVDDDGALYAVVVRTTERPQRMSAWSLVLSARGLDGWVVQVGAELALCVPPAQSERALSELAAADAEESERAREELHALRTRVPSRPSSHAWVASVLLGALLFVFNLVTGPRSAGAEWFARGASDATRVLHGEAHRTITALTLHADTAHVVSNIGFGTLAVGAVMHRTGVGVGSLLVIGAGMVGNLVNAVAHGSHHSSVGFSTAVFAAFGLLGALSFADARREPARRRTAWTALAASVALLAALGSSEKSDIFAHLFGGLAGTGFGLLVGFLLPRAPRAPYQWLAGLATVGAVIGAWSIALA